LGDPVFSDEFNGTSLNSSKWLPWYPDTPFWNTTVPGGHKTNSNEPQGYDETGLSFEDGSIVFTLHESNHAVPELEFTSGMVCSYPSYNATYGYFEAKMLLPNAPNSWPAFWLMPQDMIWPPEIDIMENWGQAEWGVYVSNGFIAPGGANSSTPYNLNENVNLNWHVYGCLWEPGRLRFYVDGNLAQDYQSDLVPDNPFYIICNLAGEKNSTEALRDIAPFSAKVDYIRSWSLDGTNQEDQDFMKLRQNGQAVETSLFTRSNGVSVPLHRGNL
jgi:beta-glucanase (GH16 family)